MLLYVHTDHKDYYGHAAQDDHLDFHTPPELCICKVQIQCCFRSTQTIRTIRDREPRTGTTTSDFYTSTELCICKVQIQCWFRSTQTIRTIRDREPRTGTTTSDFYTSTELCICKVQVQCCFTSTETILRTIKYREPRTTTSNFTQFLSSVKFKFSVALRLHRP